MVTFIDPVYRLRELCFNALRRVLLRNQCSRGSVDKRLGEGSTQSPAQPSTAGHGCRFSVLCHPSLPGATALWLARTLAIPGCGCLKAPASLRVCHLVTLETNSTQLLPGLLAAEHPGSLKNSILSFSRFSFCWERGGEPWGVVRDYFQTTAFHQALAKSLPVTMEFFFF